jgi:hypothetical protein
MLHAASWPDHRGFTDDSLTAEAVHPVDVVGFALAVAPLRGSADRGRLDHLWARRGSRDARVLGGVDPGSGARVAGGETVERGIW